MCDYYTNVDDRMYGIDDQFVLNGPIERDEFQFEIFDASSLSSDSSEEEDSEEYSYESISEDSSTSE